MSYEILWIKSSSLACSGAEANWMKSLSFIVESNGGLKGFGKSITKEDSELVYRANSFIIFEIGVLSFL